MSAYNPIAADPLDVQDPPPQELTWDSPIKDLFANSYDLSPDLLEGAPRMIRMYADRWQVNWMESGVGEPQDQTIIDLYITVRPVAPATIILKI
jgi:hypothetical protein